MSFGKLIFTLHLLSFIPLLQAQGNDKIFNDLKNLIEKEARIDKKKVPGILISIISKDSINVYSFGSRFKDNTIVLNEHSVFELGDVSKVLLTYLCLDFERKGKISLDSTLEKYMDPGFRNSAISNLTVADYLIYQTPFPRLPQNIGASQISVTQPYEHYSIDNLKEFYNAFKLPIKYTDSYVYSHTGFLLIQHMLENISGQSIDRLIENYYSNELMLKSIQFYASHPEVITKGYSLSNKLSKETIKYGIFNGSLGICSNIDDLSKFIQLLINSRLPYPKVENLNKSNNIIPTKLSKNTYSGIGWHLVKSDNDNYFLANIGAGSSTRVFCGIIPNKKLGVVIFSNSQFGINGLDFIVLNYLNAKN